MAVILSVWWLPTIVTLAIWTIATLWPLPQQGGGMFDFGRPLTALAHALVALFSTMAVWLIFFALMWGLG